MRFQTTAKRLVFAKYNWDLIASDMKATFDRLLGTGRMGLMRLVIATPLYPPEIGGPATYAKLLSEGLPAKG